MTHPAFGLALQMNSATRLLTRRFEERTRDRELTSGQWRLLVMLKRDGEMRQARLAEALDIEPISVSRMIDRMEQAGWVERLPDPDDRRARLVRPTARAMTSLRSLGDVAEAVYSEALQGFDPQEVAVLRDLIDRMVINLSTAHAAESAPQAEPLDTGVQA